MKKQNNENQENVVKKHKNTDKGQVFVKVMAGFLALLMVAGTVISVVYALMG